MWGKRFPQCRKPKESTRQPSLGRRVDGGVARLLGSGHPPLEQAAPRSPAPQGPHPEWCARPWTPKVKGREKPELTLGLFLVVRRIDPLLPGIGDVYSGKENILRSKKALFQTGSSA